MKDNIKYPIGTHGQSWGNNEKIEWLNSQSIKRSYLQAVVVKAQSIAHLTSIEELLRSFKK